LVTAPHLWNAKLHGAVRPDVFQQKAEEHLTVLMRGLDW
jgi:hypothetical protein